MVSMIFNSIKLNIIPTLPLVQADHANIAVQHTQTQYKITQGGSGRVMLITSPEEILAIQAAISIENLSGQLR